MKWSPSELAALADNDFEKAWMGTIDLVPEGGYSPKAKATPHGATELIQRVRSTFLADGYSEAMLPIFMDEAELARQRGPEAALAAADSISLASVQRKRPRLGEAGLAAIQAIAPTFNEARRKELRQLLASYAGGEFGSERLLSLMVERTGVRMEQAVEILNVLLGDVRKPAAGESLLRQSLIEPWFSTLAAVAAKEPMPLQLFSIGPCFGRGSQGLGAAYFASGAIASEKVSVDDAAAMLTKLFARLGAKAQLEKSAATSTLFIPGTEMAVLCNSIRLGRLGLLSPLALSRYGIGTPVAAFEFSLGHLAVALGLAKDDRDFLYPQFSGDWELSDRQIAALLSIGTKPSSWGRELVPRIVKSAALHATKPAPAELKIAEREVGDQKVDVYLVSSEGTLCGKDYDNELFVYDGNIVSSPALGRDSLAKDAVAHGVRTGISLLSAFAEYAAAKIEADPRSQRISVGFASDPSDVNIAVPALVRDYMRAKGKLLRVGGDVSIALVSQVKPLWRYEQPKGSKTL